MKMAHNIGVNRLDRNDDDFRIVYLTNILVEREVMYI